MTTATAPSETTPIAVGAVAPDFKLPDSEKKEWTLSEFKGKKPVALFFYPLDFSPTCSKENACFSQDLSRYEKFAQVFGISVDSVWSHKAYKAQMGLKHTLLSDGHLIVRHPEWAEAHRLAFAAATGIRMYAE